MPRIVLVDDDRSHTMSLSMMLEAEGFEVECHLDGLAAWKALSKSLPDILVLDVKLPGLDGMDVLQRLRYVSNIPVMFCTSKQDEIDEVLGLRMGADDYVKKPSSPRVLLERIRALLRRWEVLGGDQASEADDTTIMVCGPLSMDPMRHGVTWRGIAVSLTVTEFALLKALAVRPGFVKSRDQLMNVAYDDQVYVDDRTIDSHIKRLRKKMRRVDGDFDAIETLYGIGYRYNEA
jgi:two-component system response regulator ChvI